LNFDTGKINASDNIRFENKKKENKKDKIWKSKTFFTKKTLCKRLFRQNSQLAKAI